MRLSLLVMLALVPAEGLRAATFVVDTLADGVDAMPGDGTCADAAGACCLRCAVMEANALPGADEIVLGPGAHELSIVGSEEDLSATGDLDVTESLVLRGSGLDATIVAAAPGLGDRLIDGAAPDVELVLEDLALLDGEPAQDGSGVRFVVGGRLELHRCWAEGNESGAIKVVGGDLEVVDSVFRDNGGWAAIEVLSGTGSVRGTEFSGNRAAAVRAQSFGPAGWDFVIDDVRAFDNVYPGTGAVLQSVSEVRRSHVMRNSGGITASRLVEDTTVEDVGGFGIEIRPQGVVRRCVARRNDFGIVVDGFGPWEGPWDEPFESVPTLIESTTSADNGPFPLAPGIYVSHWDGTTMIVNSTVTGNVASGPWAEGAGAGIVSGDVVIRNSTITDNHNEEGDGGGLHATSGTVRLESSILHGNTAGGMGDDCLVAPGAATTDGHSLLGTSSDCDIEIEATDLVSVDPLLGPLQDNGGPTPTRALMPGSPAIDAGNPTGCRGEDGLPLTSDQRGSARPVDGDGDGDARCDVGAYEATFEAVLGWAAVDFSAGATTAAVAPHLAGGCRTPPTRLCADGLEPGAIDTHRLPLAPTGASRSLVLYDHAAAVTDMELTKTADEIVFGRR